MVGGLGRRPPFYHAMVAFLYLLLGGHFSLVLSSDTPIVVEKTENTVDGAHKNDPDWVVVSTEFLNACTHGDVEIVKRLLDEHADWINGRSGDGETCLHVAGIYGQAAVTKLLLTTTTKTTNGETMVADPNIRTTFAQGLRMHPLSWNVYAGHVDTAKVLLEHGADPNLDFDGPATDQARSDNSVPQLTSITVMDVILQMLAHDETRKDPNMKRFRDMKELLVKYNAKTYRELSVSASSTSPGTDEPEL